MQFGIFDVDNRLRRLSKMGYALERINRIVDWEMFRPIIEMEDIYKKHAD